MIIFSKLQYKLLEEEATTGKKLCILVESLSTLVVLILDFVWDSLSEIKRYCLTPLSRASGSIGLRGGKSIGIVNHFPADLKLYSCLKSLASPFELYVIPINMLN